MSPEFSSVVDKLAKALLKWRELSREIAGFVIIAGFFGTLWMLLKHEAPVDNKDVLLVLVGVLAGSFKDVVGFLWGGSFGSEKKTETLTQRDQ